MELLTSNAQGFVLVQPLCLVYFSRFKSFSEQKPLRFTLWSDISSWLFLCMKAHVAPGAVSAPKSVDNVVADRSILKCIHHLRHCDRAGKLDGKKYAKTGTTKCELHNVGIFGTPKVF